MEIDKSEVLDMKRVKALDTWLIATNTTLVQVNGQRKYGGPPAVWVGPTPGSHCEVFISQIPRDAYEDLLVPLFSSVGPLWEFRLMMNFSGQNRGFGYAKYDSPRTATEAIQALNGYVLEPGSYLSVQRSIEKRHLCIEELPAYTKGEELLQVLQSMTDGVERVCLKTGLGMRGLCALVTFSSHHTASMAKKKLVEAFKRQFLLNISVKWHSSVRLKPLEVKPPHSELPLPPVSGPPCPSALPPRRANPPFTPVGFCRAVGGPTSNWHPPPHSSSSSFSSFLGYLASTVSSSSPMLLLRKLCEVTRVGQPLYEMYFSHAAPNGIVYFSYKVCIPGITGSFEGVVMILPRPSVSTTVEEAKQAASLQVLQKMYNNQFTR